MEFAHKSTFTCLRAESEAFASQMRQAVGRAEDIPNMYFSGIPLLPTVDQVFAQDMLVVSVGGMNTHIRILQLATTGEVTLLPVVESDDIHPHFPTPCQDGKPHTLEEMWQPIISQVALWLGEFPAISHLVLSWGFPQQAVILPPDRGITGAIGQYMTKKQRAVAVRDLRLDEFLRTLLIEVRLDEQRINKLKISIQNDSVMAMQRFLKESNQYRKSGLFILGTGTNLTTAEPYLFNDNDELAYDPKGYPLRGLSMDSPKSSNEEKAYWVNYEIARLVPTHTRLPAERLLPWEPSGSVTEDIENFAQGGAGFYRVWHNLVTDERPEISDRVAKLYLSAEEISILGLQQVISDKVKSVFPDDSDHTILIDAAKETVEHCARRSGITLAAASLFCGIGLPPDGQRDMLAMEGSLWKIHGMQERIARCWESIIRPELDQRGHTTLPVDFLAKDNYNASLLGPGHLVAHFDQAI